MKTILEFEMPEDQDLLHYAQHGLDYSMILDEVEEYLRSKLKHEELLQGQYDIYQEIRALILECKKDRLDRE